MGSRKNPSAQSPRANQRHRTRKDLLAAAARLLSRRSQAGDIGVPLEMGEVAAEAMVSRATAYRYFPTIDALLLEAPLDGVIPGPDQIFATCASDDAVVRTEHAEKALHEVISKNESGLRLMLAAQLQQSVRPGASGVPLRQNRRTPIIEAALRPVRIRLPTHTYNNLRAALALVFGVESMIVLRDVLNLDTSGARQVKKWAAEALVRSALAERPAKRSRPRRATR